MATDDYTLMMQGITPVDCTCEMVRDVHWSLGNPPEPAEWQINYHCKLHGEE